MSESRLNVFSLFASHKALPFAVSRWNWADSDFAVVTEVSPKGDYGVARGFPVRDNVPNDHFAYHRPWREDMIMPNAGSYQWRIIPLPETRLEELVRTFHATVAPQFEFYRPVADAEEEFL